jgi:uncharacterized protein YmfQ (DUF2313 family)
MALNAKAYLQQLQALLPQGLAWPRTIDAYLTKLLSAFSQELGRLDLRIDNLIDEADPRTTLELLPEWERLAGLPDPCVTSDQTVEQRQSALVTKLTMQVGQSRAYYIQMAEDLGYPDTTIEEYFPFTCESYCDEFLNSLDDRHTWTIYLPSDGGFEFMTCESPCDSYLQSFGDQVIECRINQYKPAHTAVLFAYTD